MSEYGYEYIPTRGEALRAQLAEAALYRRTSTQPCDHIRSGVARPEHVHEVELPSDGAINVFRCPICGHQFKHELEG